MSQRGRNDTKTKGKTFGVALPTLSGAQTFKRPAPSCVENEPRTNGVVSAMNTRSSSKLSEGRVPTHSVSSQRVVLTKQPVASPMQVEPRSASKKQAVEARLQDRRSVPFSVRPDPSYVSEITEFLHNVQMISPPINWAALSITPRMRLVLIDWLIEVAEEYRLQDQTLFLAVSYLEHCLARPVVVARDTLQLLGITCLFVAAKLEEVYPPPLSEFAYITDHTYNVNQILQQENRILGTLGFHLTHVTIQDFLTLFLLKYRLELPEQKCFAMYLAQLIIPSQDLFRTYLPSELAVAIAMLTAYTFDNNWVWLLRLSLLVKLFPLSVQCSLFRP
eukprot:TRINITY_DN3534_c0_g1_i2.p1 TRINITY_DN3534_c0_g1~~TRINITY_DN3534_c0_g1_i2.p1  ORF type:complete len:333 (-),score=38.67 TRINITY_DN3534_c0_g1_i2:435-1433(-)